MRILIVEDDTKISAFIKIGLECHDYIVDNVYDGIAGEKLALSKSYDVIILDVLLPGISGLELCKKIRDFKISTPILLMSALESEDKINRIMCGADDYLVKPFSFQDLLVKVKALQSKNASHNP